MLATEIRQRELTLVIVSHRPELDALPGARRYTLRDGQLHPGAPEASA